MNIFLAVNNKSLENYIIKQKDCNVIKVKKDNKGLINEVIEYNPHLLIMSSALIQKEENSVIIGELRKRQLDTRIVFLYGEDDCYRKTFTNFLIENGVYDWHIGAINEDVIDKLIREPKSLDDVLVEDISKDEIEALKKHEEEKMEKMKKIQDDVRDKLDEKDLTEEEINEEINEEIEKVLIKEVKKLEVRIIDRIEEIETEKIIEKEVYKTKILNQKTFAIMSLTSQSYKDFIVSNLSSVLGEEHKVLVIDFETPFPTLDLPFNVEKYIFLEDVYTSEMLTGVKGCLSAYHKNVLNKSSFKTFVKKTKDKNIDVLTGLYDVEAFDSCELDDIREIIKVSKENYEIVIISLNQFIANSFTYASLSEADKVLLVSEDTYSNARSNISFIKEMVESQKESKGKFGIVIYGEQYLDDTVNYKMYEGYSFMGRVESNIKDNFNALNQRKICVRENLKEREAYNSLITKLGFAEIKQKGIKALVQKIKEVVS